MQRRFERRDPVRTREATLQRLCKESFDLVVLGGGITGCGVARDAALRGQCVALIEREDFGSGTSSKSTKLVHGGLRYLEHGQVGQVFESVNERTLLMRLARHLVRPLPFLVPRYAGDRRWLATLDLGLWAYDALCAFRNYKLHRTHFRKRTLQLEPGLREHGLSGSVLYYDCQTNDARLCIENAIDAQRLGAAVANHIEAQGLLKTAAGAIHGVAARDALTGKEFEIRARVIVNACGPWVDAVAGWVGAPPLVRPSKGVHLVVDAQRLAVHHANLILSPRDRRVMFVIPWGWGRTVLGTTDTFHDDSPEKVRAEAGDVDYLLEAANAYFPSAKLSESDVISTWAGLRPLLRTKSGGPSAVPREHILRQQQGFITIAGGKLTTYRRMARQVVDRVAAQLKTTRPSLTHERALPGAQGIEASDAKFFALREALIDEGADSATADYLCSSYGVRAIEVWDRNGNDRLDPELPCIASQVDHAVCEEFAMTLDDVFSRRLEMLTRSRDAGLGAAPAVLARMGAHLGWSGGEGARQLSRYRESVASANAFRRQGMRKP